MPSESTAAWAAGPLPPSSAPTGITDGSDTVVLTPSAAASALNVASECAGMVGMTTDAAITTAPMASLLALID